LAIIVGPSSQGKSSLAKQIQDAFSGNSVQISHDEIVQSIDPNQPQQNIDNEYRQRIIDLVTQATWDESVDLIILDTVNIRSSALEAFLFLITIFGRDTLDDITLIKMNIPLETNLVYARRHYPDIKDISKIIIAQRKLYSGRDGSLHRCFVDNEIIVTDTVDKIVFK